jgi:hypothetical protein
MGWGFTYDQDSQPPMLDRPCSRPLLDPADHVRSNRLDRAYHLIALSLRHVHAEGPSPPLPLKWSLIST